MKRLQFFSLAILTIALLALNAQASGFRVKKPDFTVTFPEGFPKPADQATTGDFKGGRGDRGHEFVSRANGVICTAGYIDQPLVVSASMADLALRTVIRRATEDAKVGEFESFSKSNCPAMRAVSATAQRVLRIQVVMNGRRVYMLVAQAKTRDAVSSPAVNAFFRSLILTNPCALAAKPLIAISGALDKKPPFSATYPPGYSSPEARSIGETPLQATIYTASGPHAGSAWSVLVVRKTKEEIGASAPSFVNRMLHEYADTRLRIESEEAFTRRGEPGKRAIVQRGAGGVFGRVETLLSGETMYLIEFIAPDREGLNRPEVERFFDSFRPEGSAR